MLTSLLSCYMSAAVLLSYLQCPSTLNLSYRELEISDFLYTPFYFSSDACDTNWQLSRDGLIIAGFVSSILVLILAIILPLVLILAYNLRREDEGVSNYSFKVLWICVT